MTPEAVARGSGLTAHQIALRLSDGQRPSFTLTELNLSLAAGELLLLQGLSGCGKSTLLQALARLIPLQTGGLYLDGLAAAGIPPSSWRTRVSLLHAEPLLVDGSLADNLLLPWRFKALQHLAPPPPEDLREGLAALGLDDAHLQADIRGFSSGQTARITLLRNLLMRPAFLLLDEPAANLDPESAQRVWRLLEAQRSQTGCGMICVSHHRRGLAPDRVLRLRNGRLKEG
ncbi:MAG: ATP-binding cassette domain-containing protein [SAR324 cluster bacterium]|nr:ATP-binding cassette domain-containing protein [SAR324 cluster bacterium]